MSANIVWSNIISILNEAPMEIATVPSNNREPLWFYALTENGNIFVQNAIFNKPSTKISKKGKFQRKILILYILITIVG